MWNYERRLQYPVNITSPNAKIAQIILSQYGGPDGEAAASFRYLSQRYSMPDRKVAGLLTDIGTEELAHLEMVASIVRQLTKGLSAEELEEAGGGDLLLNLCGVVGALCLATQALQRPLLAQNLVDLVDDVAKLFHGSNFLSCFVLW